MFTRHRLPLTLHLLCFHAIRLGANRRWSSFRAYAYGETGPVRVNDWSVLKSNVGLGETTKCLACDARVSKIARRGAPTSGIIPTDLGHPADRGSRFLEAGGRQMIVGAAARYGGKAGLTATMDALDAVPVVDIFVGIVQGVKATYDGVSTYMETYDKCMENP